MSTLKCEVSILSREEVEKIHHTSIRILEEIGMKIEHERMLKSLQAIGAKVDFNTMVVKFPRKLVEDCMKRQVKLANSTKDGAEHWADPLTLNTYKRVDKPITIDLGVRWLQKNPYKPDYFKPQFRLKSLGDTSFIFYSQGQKVELDGGTELGYREDPYFNRDIFHFCSHQHTPSSCKYGGPGMVESENGIYFAWNVFADYAGKGSLALKESVVYALNRLLPDKTLETDLPAQGVVTFTKQESQNRYINHLLYASPVRRGERIEVIEDIVPIYDVKVTLKIPDQARKVYLAPQLEEIPFQQDGNTVSYTVPGLECHQMVVIDY